MEFKNEMEILLDMIDSSGNLNVSEETLNKIKEGQITENQYVLDFSTHAKPLSELHDLCREVDANSNVLTATGEALDNFGKLRNIARVSGLPAMVDITVSVATASDEDITVPSGTVLLVDDAVLGDGDVYVTSSEIIIPAGVTSAEGTAESIIYGYRSSLPASVVRGLNGYPTLTVTNTDAGVNGVDIEEDEEYRQRVTTWNTNVVGTYSMIDNYLSHYEGIDSYKLIPRYDGVGSLKIVCDTLESLLNTIRDDVYTNCMPVGDNLPMVVRPTNTTLQELTLTVDVNPTVNSSLTSTELLQLIEAQTRVYVEGGTRRNGLKYGGMSIGDDFYPARLLSYLVDEIPEIAHIQSSETEIITVPDTNIFIIDDVEVEYNE